MSKLKFVVLAGGVGGAKLAHGLAMILPPEQLTIIGNTGDDFIHLGLNISPDLDTVMHTLAGVDNREMGWGRADESWRVMENLRKLGGPDWFNLGDVDLATHLTRTHLLNEGQTLTEATAQLCEKLGMTHTLLPMCDKPAPTMISTPDGVLGFQEWFVRDRWQPAVREVQLPDAARATPSVVKALNRADVVVIAPSNPFVSVAPILNAYPIRPIITDTVPVCLAISPIIDGQAVKGPAAKMFKEAGIEPSAQAVADFYGDLINGFVHDKRDSHPIKSQGLKTFVTDTWMKSDEDRRRLADEIVNFAEQFV